MTEFFNDLLHDKATFILTFLITVAPFLVIFGMLKIEKIMSDENSKKIQVLEKEIAAMKKIN